MNKEKLRSLAKEIAKWIERPLVVFDLETTGANPEKDELIQFAAIRIDKAGEGRSLRFMCKPAIPVCQEAIEVHGISNEELADKPPFSNFAKEVSAFFRDADVAGFNVGFDLRILNRQMSELGLNGEFDNSYILDAYAVFKKHCTRKLADAVRFYTGEEIEDAHDALGDVKSTIAVLAHQLHREAKPMLEVASESFRPPGERVGFTDHIVLENKDYVINFGKSKGIRLKDMDKSYLRWIVNSDFPMEVRSVVSKFL